MIFTLLAYKPYKDRQTITSLSEQDLEQTFNDFLNSDICPSFVKDRYHKLNKKKENKKKNQEKDMFTSQDEIQEDQFSSSSSEESEFENDNQRQIPAHHKEQCES